MERTLSLAVVASLALAACAQKADNVVMDPPRAAPSAYASPAQGAAESTSPGTTADDSHGYQQGNQVGMEADFGPLPPRGVPPREPAEPRPGQ